MEFGKLLKQERKKMNLTQADLAEQLNVSRSAISNWEIGRNYPDIQTIIDISNVLGVSLDYLLNEDQKIMEAVDNDLTKKKKTKKISVILAGLLLVAIGTIIFLLYPKKPTIIFVNDVLPKNSEISTLKKHEIKEVFLEDHQLKIILHITGNEAGYYVESGADEMTVSLYKTKNKSLKSNKLIPYDGVFTIDLIEYPRLKNIYIAYSPN